MWLNEITKYLVLKTTWLFKLKQIRIQYIHNRLEEEFFPLSFYVLPKNDLHYGALCTMHWGGVCGMWWWCEECTNIGVAAQCANVCKYVLTKCKCVQFCQTKYVQNMYKMCANGNVRTIGGLWNVRKRQRKGGLPSNGKCLMIDHCPCPSTQQHPGCFIFVSCECVKAKWRW